MIISELFETPQQCPECGGISFSDLILAEKKDACYHKVKASAKVWPSAYASGRLVQCRKKGAANYGNKSEGVMENNDPYEPEAYDEFVSDTYSDDNPEDEQGMAENTNAVDINQIASQMQFLPTTKLAKQYKFVKDGIPGQMPAMTYTVSTQEQPVVTVTSDGKETQNVATPTDVIMSGPSKENYVVKAAKFPKLYQGTMGGPVIPEQSPRLVALYAVKMPVTFTAPWGESMILKPGDYLVKDGDAGYYRIAKLEYDQTYNKPGSNGQQGVAETRKGQVPMTLKPGETDNLEPEDSEGFKKLPAYQQGQQAQKSRGKDLIQQSPYTYQSDQDWAYRNGAFDQRQAAVSADFAKRGPLTTAEGEQKKPKEAEYGPEYDDMVARVKKLAGLGPMKTVYDPVKRVYRNVPTAVQPPKK